MTHLGFASFAQEEKHLISQGHPLIHPCCLSSTPQNAMIYKLTRKAEHYTGDVWKKFFFGISRNKLLLFLC